jgi:hypothetical protein
MKIQDFVDEINYMMGSAVDALDINDPEEMIAYKEAVAGMMEANCGDIFPFEVINEKGQIQLMESENEK